MAGCQVRESAGILLTGKMSAFCTRQRNSGIWRALREAGKNAGILVFDQFAKENMTRLCSNFGTLYQKHIVYCPETFCQMKDHQKTDINHSKKKFYNWSHPRARSNVVRWGRSDGTSRFYPSWMSRRLYVECPKYPEMAISLLRH